MQKVQQQTVAGFDAVRFMGVGRYFFQGGGAKSGFFQA